MYIIPEIHIFGSNTFIYCSSITVVLVHINFLSKINPVCRNIANGIEPGRDLKRLISMLPIA